MQPSPLCPKNLIIDRQTLKPVQLGTHQNRVDNKFAISETVKQKKRGGRCKARSVNAKAALCDAGLWPIPDGITPIQAAKDAGLSIGVDILPPATTTTVGAHQKRRSNRTYICVVCRGEFHPIARTDKTCGQAPCVHAYELTKGRERDKARQLRENRKFKDLVTSTYIKELETEIAVRRLFG